MGARVPVPLKSAPPRRERVWKRLARQWPLTATGLALLLLAGAVLAYGRARMDLVLTLAGLFWIALSVLSGVLNCFAAWRLHAALRPAGGEAGTPVVLSEDVPGVTGLVLPRWHLPMTAQPRLAWIVPPGRADLVVSGNRWSERVTPHERCQSPHLVREFRQEDLLGLWRIRGRIADPRPVQVLPDPGRLTASEIAACLASGDLLSYPFGPAKGDMIDARTYTPSDPARLILWKVYARTRQLLVRTPEQARSPERQPLVYLVAGDGDNAAAATMRVVIESRLLGEGARFAADGTPVPTTDAAEAMEAVCGSVAHRDRAGLDLARTLSHPTVDADDPVVLVVAATPGPGLSEVLRRVAERPDRFLVLAAGDARAPGQPARTWERWIFAAADDRAPGWDAMVAVLSPVVRTGTRVALADRRSGRIVALAGHTVPTLRELQPA